MSHVPLFGVSILILCAAVLYPALLVRTGLLKRRADTHPHSAAKLAKGDHAGSTTLQAILQAAGTKASEDFKPRMCVFSAIALSVRASPPSRTAETEANSAVLHGLLDNPIG